MDVISNEQVAARWQQGLSGDWAILEELSSPTMKVWHSNDGLWITREEGAARIAAMDATASPPPFRDVRTIATESGFIVQATIPDTGKGTTHILQVCTVENGRIASCEEFIAPEFG
jgi:hypothetical protein